MAAESELHICPVNRDEWGNALGLLFAAETESVRRDRVAATLRAVREQPAPFSHLLEARRNELRVGVVWGQVLPGRTACIWPVSLVAGEPNSTARQLQATLDQRLFRDALVMAQALLPISATGAAAALLENGYVRAAGLLYLASDHRQFPTEPISTPLEFVPYRAVDEPRLSRLVDETYVATQDVPLMDGLRTTSDVLAGYQATGQHSPDRWFFARHQTHDQGCLLLTDHPELDHWELVYMGLIPAARRQGWGTDLVRYAQWRTGQAMRRGLLVSVDAANGPAVMAYSRCGFVELDRREVWIKRF